MVLSLLNYPMHYLTRKCKVLSGRPVLHVAAHLQVFAGLHELAWGCEHFGPQVLVDDLVEEPLRFADFRIHLPAGPASA